MGVDNHQATIIAVERLRYSLRKKNQVFVQAIVDACDRGKESSFGMAKLFVNLPTHQFQDSKLLLEKVEDYQASSYRKETQQRHRNLDRHRSSRRDGEAWKSRLASFRSHQKKQPLPVDSIETKIPHDAAVTIVRGGTGSGKVRTICVGCVGK
jgi:hypothetical protein